MNTIGQALAQYRADKGIYIREAAANAHVDAAQWSRWERGDLDPSRMRREEFVRLGILTAEQAALPARDAA